MIAPSRSRFRPNLTSTALALGAILLAALGLRLYGLDWDDGRWLHPDEMFITQHVLVGRIHLEWPPDLDALLDPAISGLNPRSVEPGTSVYREYAYGALPLLVTDGAAEVLSWITGTDWHLPDRVYLVGRALSALLDTFTVLLVFLIGRRAFGPRSALIAAVVAALAPMSIQLAHFFTTDSWLTCFVACCLYAAIRAAEGGGLRWFTAAGGTFGLAMATKGSVFTLAGLIGVALAYDVWRRWRSGETPVDALAAVPERVALSGFAAVAAFALFEPYALMKPDVWLRDLTRQADIVRGIYDAPFTRQYIGTPPILYQVEHLLKWGLGPVATLLAFAGVALLLRRVWPRFGAGETLILAWLAGYGLVVALPETKFLRYLAPLIPVFALLAGVALDALWRQVRRLRTPRLATTVVALLLAGVGLSTATFVSVYARDHTRLEASHWIYANVPNGSAITAEYWDDALPIPLGVGFNNADRQYETVAFDLYAVRPPVDAASYIFEVLDRADYVVLSSDRLRRAIPRSPWRYAVQTRYYELLEAGQLGFRRVAEFRHDPGIGPFTVRDTDADESLLNYDHPRVLVYQKRSLVSRATYDGLMAHAVAQPWFVERNAPRPSLLLDEPVGERPVVDDARWSEPLTGNSLAALLVWIVLLGALQVAGWPLASLAFGRFADAGWAFGRLLALLVAGYLVWIGASLHLVAFRAAWAAGAVLLVGGIGWWARARFRRRHDLWRFAPGQDRVALGGEAVFWGVFGLFLLFRYLNPDGWHPIWGGERPMEFAHLNATLRSAHFPPYDPWYADGYINYYYYGLYLVAFCIKLTGIPSEIAFNLAQPTLIALLASAGFGVAATLGRDLTRRRTLAVPAGLTGAFLLVVAGNLAVWRVLLQEVRPRADDFGAWVWSSTRVINGNDTITEFPFFTGLYADLHAHVVALPITALTIALSYAVARDARLFALAVARRSSSGAARAVVVTRLALFALAIGTLSATNAWDVPAYAALGGAALFMAGRLIASWTVRLAVLLGVGLAVAALAYLLFLPFFQHYVALFSELGRVRTTTPVGDLVSHLGGLLAVVALGAVTLFLPRRLPASAPLAEPLVPLVLFLGLVGARSLATSLDLDAGVIRGLEAASIITVAATVLLAAWDFSARRALQRGVSASRVATLAGIVGSAVAFLSDRPALAILLLFATVGFVLWLGAGTTARRFVGLMVAGGASIAAGTELVFVVDNLAGGSAYRMNTIFKFYNQVWVLLALAGAALIARMFADSGLPLAATIVRLRSSAHLGVVFGGRPLVDHIDRSARDMTETATVSARQRWARAGLVGAGAVLLASLAYPLLATSPRLHQRFTDHLGSGTLNALDWMDYGVVAADNGPPISYAEDRAVIDWFNQDVPGSPVIAEATTATYRCNGSRISNATGLPTIIGWSNHQSQQRYSDDLLQRETDVRELYRTSDTAAKLQILRRYNVEFVVVGNLERLYPAGGSCEPDGSAEGIAALEGMLGSVLDIAFSLGDTTVYRVRPPQAVPS